MKDHVLNLFKYNEWANKRLFVKLPEVIDDDPNILLLFSHLVMAEKVWLSRVRGTHEAYKIWDPIPLPELIRHINQSAQQWAEFIHGVTDRQFREQISYLNLKGVPFQNTLEEIVTHTVNHSTHHRGQIVMRIRQQGHTPPVLDYIAFARNE